MAEFIDETIEPFGEFDAVAMSRSEPGLPEGFRWRGRECRIMHMLSSSKGLGPDRTHGSSERYVQRHWYALEMDDGSHWNVYFDRFGHGPHPWRLYTREERDL